MLADTKTIVCRITDYLHKYADTNKVLEVAALLPISTEIKKRKGIKMKIYHKTTKELIFEGTNLRGANLQYANLQYANLQYANLRGADLQYADLRGADLQYADLQGADLQYADLRGANLRGANLRGANLRGGNIDFSAWPLMCSSLQAIADDQIAAQLLYHAFAVAGIEPTAEQIEFIKNFKRFDACGGADRLKKKGGCYVRKN